MKVKIGVSNWLFKFGDKSIGIKTVTKEKVEYTHMGNIQIQITFWENHNELVDFLKNNTKVEIEREEVYCDIGELNEEARKIIKEIECFPIMRIVGYKEYKEKDYVGFVTMNLETI